MSVLLCHVVWMPRYAKDREEEVRAGGFGYEGVWYERFNFFPVQGTCYGYVQTRGGTININRIGAARDDTFFDGVTVIWTAQHPNGGRVVVGWYDGARVYRNHQRSRVAGRLVDGERIPFNIQAGAENCFLVAEDQRSFRLPRPERGERGLPGMAGVFFPEESNNQRMVHWLSEASQYLAAWPGSAIAETADPSLGTRGRGWSTQPDCAHNAAVEAAAIACVLEHLGNPTNDRQKDNCGWDLEFAANRGTLCVEVKGLSGSEIAVE